VSTAGVDNFTQSYRPSVSELPSPVSELVSAITGGMSIHSRKYPISSENLNEIRSLNFCGIDA
tara:strand:+ start:375 stop:563 length:189 start_codon:yes stop_codon:yes gene_type:complete